MIFWGPVVDLWNTQVFVVGSVYFGLSSDSEFGTWYDFRKTLGIWPGFSQCRKALIWHLVVNRWCWHLLNWPLLFAQLCTDVRINVTPQSHIESCGDFSSVYKHKYYYKLHQQIMIFWDLWWACGLPKLLQLGQFIWAYFRIRSSGLDPIFETY